MTTVNDQIAAVVAEYAERYAVCLAAGAGSVRLEVADRFVAMAHFSAYNAGPFRYRSVDWWIYVNGKLIASDTRQPLTDMAFVAFDAWIGANRSKIDAASDLTD